MSVIYVTKRVFISKVCKDQGRGENSKCRGGAFSNQHPHNQIGAALSCKKVFYLNRGPVPLQTTTPVERGDGAIIREFSKCL